jgi:hypothetical protein
VKILGSSAATTLLLSFVDHLEQIILAGNFYLFIFFRSFPIPDPPDDFKKFLANPCGTAEDLAPASSSSLAGGDQKTSGGESVMRFLE